MTDVIRELPPDDRPRERLLKHGAATLSNAELVGILLGSGTRGRNAIQLARDLLGDGLRGLSVTAVSEMVRTRGIGVAKAARIAAAFELSHRFGLDPKEAEPPRFNVNDFGTNLVRRMCKFQQERLGAALLDAQHRLLGEREVFVGTINHALVSTRDVIAYALENYALGVVLYHNHPSGESHPSSDDIEFTTKMKHSLDLCDIKLVDHLIVGKHSFTMLSANGIV
jgi:DNA repair protein RadC